MSDKVIGTAVGSLRTVNTSRQRPAADSWEYTNTTAEADSSGLLNSMGSDGWELVSVVPEAASRVTFYFKRRKRS